MTIKKYVSRTDYSADSDMTVIFAEVSRDGISIARKKFTRGWFFKDSIEEVYKKANDWADEQIRLAELYEHNGPTTRGIEHG